MGRRYSGLFLLLSCAVLAQDSPTPKAISTGEAFRAPVWTAVGELGPATAEGRLRVFSDQESREVPAPSVASDGTQYIVFQVQSEGAASLRLHFSEFHLPSNARLYLYSLPADGSDPAVFGPYTAAGPLKLGDFWSPAVPGARAAIELQWTGDLDELPFRIGEAGHLDELAEILPDLPDPEVAPGGVALYRGRRVPFEVINGLAVSENCILLGRPDELTAADKGDAERESTGIVGSSYRWPGGVIPYVVDPGLPNQQRVTDAVAHWNTKLAGTIKLVPRTTQANYVTFTRGTGCSSYVGSINYAGQPINLADACSTGNAIHEIGHAVGLWHEHTRNDRDSYITVESANIDPNSSYNFQKTGSTGLDLGAYDYGSIMHYGAYSFSINSLPTIVTIPPGIPIGQRDALSSGDINGARALYPTSAPAPPPAPVSVTVTSTPTGMAVTVDGVAATTPATYSWTPGTAHTLAAANQAKSGTTYNFSAWSDGGAATHSITTPTAAASYRATFAAAAPAPPAPVSITVTSSPTGMLVTVDGASAVTPAVYSWTPGTTHTVAAAGQAKSGSTYNFSAWSDGGAATHVISTPTVASTYTASFVLPAVLPVSVTVGSNPAGLTVSVDGNAVLAPATFSWMPGTVHTLGAANQVSAGKTYLYGSGSDGGAAVHSITTPSAAASYTAAFTLQPPVAITVTSAPAGLTVTVDGSNVTTPAVFSWQPGTAHSVAAATQDSAGKRYLFNSWSNGGGASQTLTTPASAATYTANFTQQLPTTVTFTSTPAGLVVSVDGAAITTPASFSWFPGTAHSIAAASQISGGSSYSFSSWSNGGAATQTIVTPAVATVYSATFALQPFTYTVNSNPTGLQVTVDGVTVTAPKNFSWLPGTVHTLGAASQSGAGTRYAFNSWSNGGAASQTVTVPSYSAVYAANFSKQYLVGTPLAPIGGGTISASPASTDGYYPANTSLGLTATPAAGYCFVNWTGSASSNNPVLSLSVAQPLSLTANFAAGSITLAPTTLIVPGAGGAASLNVTATCPWTFAAPPAWARLSHTTGAGNAVVSITVDPNPSTAARMFYLTSGSRRVLVYQYPK
jgi:hypothetical protein